MKNILDKLGKKWLVLAVAMILLVVIIVFLVINFPKPKTDNNDLLKTVTVEGLKIDNVKLTTKEKQTVYEADVTNITDKTYEKEAIDVILKDKNGDTLIVLLGYIGEGVKVGEKRHIEASTAMDMSKDIVKKIEYKIHEEPVTDSQE